MRAIRVVLMLSVALAAFVFGFGCNRKPSNSTKQAAAAKSSPATAGTAQVTGAQVTLTTLDGGVPKGDDGNPVPSCAGCREYWCRNWADSSYDVVGGCLEAPNAELVKNPDPNFIADCKRVIECAFKNNCAYDRTRGPAHCYCGSKFVDECQETGPAADAPCVAEWQAATRSKDNQEILRRFDDATFPSGWAFHLLECDRDRCDKDSRWGQCTPK